MMLSKHFTLLEFTRSQTAARRGIKNDPGPREIAAMKLLCEKVLEPIRVHFDRPVRISSGYRSPALNRAVGGSRTSSHVKGEAADIEVDGVSNVDLAKWCHRNLNYDQVILEFYTPGQPTSGWVHISYKEPYRNQELTARRVGGRTQYVNGIVA